MSPEKYYTDSFARIYDDIMSSVPYDLWYKYLSELLISYDKKPKNILEMACGTGNMSIRFAENCKNYRYITGIDKSPHMLKIAKEKIVGEDYRINFKLKDIRDFNYPLMYDFIFCIFDSLNYILEVEDIKKVFCNVYNSLSNEGIFIFDLNTTKRLMSINPGVTVFNGDNYTCIWEDIIDREKTRWKVNLNIYFNNDRTKCFEEIHEETSYKKKNILNILYKIGFADVEVFKAFTFDKGKDSDNRLYYIAFKKGDKRKKISIFNKFTKKIKWKVLSSCY